MISGTKWGPLTPTSQRQGVLPGCAMQRLPIVLALTLAALACGGTSAGARAVFVLIDVGSEAARVASPQRVSDELLRRLPTNEPLGFARIDRQGIGDQELLARVGQDPRPAAASEQRRAFREDLERLLRQPGTGQAQLLPGLEHAVRWLHEAGVRTKVLIVLADLERDAAEIGGAGELDLEGIEVVAWRAPVRASLSENGTPPAIRSAPDAREVWRRRVESAGARLHVLDGVAGLTSWLES